MTREELREKISDVLFLETSSMELDVEKVVDIADKIALKLLEAQS